MYKVCAAVGTTSHLNGLESCAVCGTSGTVSQNRRAVLNLSARIYMLKNDNVLI